MTQVVASGSLSSPRGLAIDSSGRMIVADQANNAIRSVVSGVVSTLSGSSLGSANGLGTVAKFNAPYDVAVSSSGVIFVADSSNYQIRSIDTSGQRAH